MRARWLGRQGAQLRHIHFLWNTSSAGWGMTGSNHFFTWIVNVMKVRLWDSTAL
jgi:hypothetical protein